ncbi:MULTISPECIES: PP2C family protein-serine/threonine phosphatase [Pseudofrankia]|uniref:PP2C family protein-serine/threonine phosphatase n=1 Tax=Pseudofrankia TaxID=2994363 RepID=UPI000234B143|nr:MULTISPECIES: PP2C family protein-serine/threonine phosphatase [Pseudofrankia]OHV31830.1 hypothetical protein BCD49_06025 [Pseudofrankia sp. EUN1h]
MFAVDSTIKTYLAFRVPRPRVPHAPDPVAGLTGGSTGGSLVESPWPPGVEVAARCRAGRDGVPGDFFGLFRSGAGRGRSGRHLFGRARLDEERCALVIGDVCGNGLQAARVAQAALRTVREVSRRETAPRRIVDYLNTAMLDAAPDSECFLTAVCITLRPAVRGYRAVLCSAGHPPVLVRRRDGTVREITTNGIALGVTADPQLNEYRFRLRPGDTLLLYTDGVTEARRRDEQYGEPRLRGHFARVGGLEPGLVARSVVQAALDYCDSVVTDDITVVALRVS